MSMAAFRVAGDNGTWPALAMLDNISRIPTVGEAICLSGHLTTRPGFYVVVAVISTYTEPWEGAPTGDLGADVLVKPITDPYETARESMNDIGEDSWRHYDELPILLRERIKPLWGVDTVYTPYEAYQYCVRDGQLVDRKRVQASKKEKR